MSQHISRLGFLLRAGHRAPTGAGLIRKWMVTLFPPSTPPLRAPSRRACRGTACPCRGRGSPAVLPPGFLFSPYRARYLGQGAQRLWHEGCKLLSYFLYGWPDLYNSANLHCGVYRVKTGCAPACLSALSAHVIFLGSCFHDKIFSDSIFAYKPLKVYFASCKSSHCVGFSQHLSSNATFYISSP